MTQHHVFDSDAAAAARDEAITRVEDHADEDWLDAAHRAVIETARTCPYFTTDRLWWLLSTRGVPPPREPRALGAVMLRAQRGGIIARTNEDHKTVRVTSHHRPIRVWRSLIHPDAIAQQ